MSSIVFVRHGQARFGGDDYDDLSDLGRVQSEVLGAWFGERTSQFHEVLTGPRRRQRTTAELVLRSAALESAALLVEPELDEFGEGQEILRAAERAYGVALLGEGAEDSSRAITFYSKAYRQWSEGRVSIPGRESYTDFRRRVQTWFADYTSRAGRSGHRSLVVTSAGVISAIVCDVLELDDSQWRALIGVIGNASMTEILYSGTRKGLRTFNSASHLPDALVSGI